MASNGLWGDADAPVPEPVKRECQVRRLVRGWRLDLAQREAGDDAALLAIVTAARAQTMELPIGLRPTVVRTLDALFALHAAAATLSADTTPMFVGVDCEFYRNTDNRQALSTVQLAFPTAVYVVVLAVPGFRETGVGADAGAVLQVLLDRTDVRVCGYQIAQDVDVLSRAFPGLLSPDRLERIVDVAMECQNLGLAAACKTYLGSGLDKSLSSSDWRSELSARQEEYAALDAEATRRLACVRLSV